MRTVPFTSTFFAGLLALSVGQPVAAQDVKSQPPEGTEKTTKTKVLELGASVLQGTAPLRDMDIYLDGFHVMKDNPQHQMEAHHYCHQVNEDFAQCVLFDGNTRDANLTGIEYIISERLFEQLPQDERPYWHPHNGEILSGQLIAPGIPEVAERELMRSKMNSYGKTWHVWSTPMAGQAGDKLPLGPALLAWSVSRQGELRNEFIEQRDQRMGVSTAEIARRRQELRALAKPQEGVDALKSALQGQLEPIPGVVDKQAAQQQITPASTGQPVQPQDGQGSQTK